METPVTARAALLQVLLEGPGYGLELADRVFARTNGGILIRQGSLYPALQQFTDKGLVSASERPAPTTAHSRTYYKLTKKGMAEAQRLRGLMSSLMAGPQDTSVEISA